MTPPDREPAPLTLRLFGPFEVQLPGGRPLPPLRSRRGLRLLALLALRPGREVERSWLAGVLWPESTEGQARESLRKTVNDLRKVLGPEAARLLSPTTRALALDLAGASVDLLAFDAAIRRGDAGSLAEAVGLYSGPLLDGWDDEWVAVERAARQAAYLAALERLAEHRTEAGEPAEAARLLRLAITADPLRESSHRGLMEALAAAGDYAAVTTGYRELRSRLHRELNAEPGAESRALYHSLRSEARQKASSARTAVSRSTEPPTIAPAASPGRLPRPLTRFVGREQELSEVGSCIAAFRLVTLTGAGGVGKTRLALQAAEDARPGFPDGAWFVDLSAQQDAGLVGQVVSAALGVKEEPGREPAETLAAHLADRALLLVLDNCEHLIAACADLAARLLERCPRLRVLATSRQSFGLTGEVVLRVDSLRVPPAAGGEADTGDGVGELLQCDSVSLFADRAELAQPSFRLSRENARAVAQVCRQVEGIPLALELAAARLRHLSVEQLAARLDDRFGLLTGGSRTALPRQQTLRAAIDWSYQLLSGSEREFLRRLAVFSGGWTLDAARSVCSAPGAPEYEVLDLLQALMDRSLVVRTDDGAGEPRYGMLESLREYAREALERAGDAEKVRTRHQEWCLALAGEAGPHFTGPEQTKWLDRLEAEHDNLRAALDWSLSLPPADRIAQAPEAALWLAAALQPFWLVRGHYTEGRQRLAAALAAAEPGTPGRAEALGAAGSLDYYLGDDRRARDLLEESLELHRSAGSLAGAAAVLNDLALVVGNHGDRAGARRLYEESVVLHRQLDLRPGLAKALLGLGGLAWKGGEFGLARGFVAEALALNRELGNQRGISAALCCLGNVANDQGDYDTARSHYEEALSLAADQGNKRGLAAILGNLGLILKSQGDTAGAQGYYEQSLAVNREVNDRRGIAIVLLNLVGLARTLPEDLLSGAYLRECLELCREIGDGFVTAYALEAGAGLASARGQPDLATCLLGAADALREAVACPLPPRERADLDRLVSDAQASLGEGGFAAAWETGRGLSAGEALDRALDGLPPITPGLPSPRHPGLPD